MIFGTSLWARTNDAGRFDMSSVASRFTIAASCRDKPAMTRNHALDAQNLMKQSVDE
jgi:hypothetical protein